MSLWRKATSALRRFAAAEDGSGTVFSLMFFASILFVAGMSIDISRLQALTVRMQNTADSAAYVAMGRRTFSTEQVATAAALTNVAANMPTSLFGKAVLAADVEWGTWNATTRTFTKTAGGIGAVRVTVRQVRDRMNPFRNSLLNLVGLKSFDATRTAVVVSDDGNCAGKRDGFVSELTVNFTSNAELREGFCIHSNTGVSFNSNTIIQPGVSITMPNSLPSWQGGNLTIPTSAYTPAVQGTLSNARYNIGLLTQMPRIIQSLKSPSTSRFVPRYITDRSRLIPITDVTPMKSNTYSIKNNTLTPGFMYEATCTAANQSILVEAGAKVDRVVLVTNCPIKFAQNTVWESSLLASENTETVSIGASPTTRIGAVDTCAPGGGSQMLTMGGASFPSGMTIYGGQIVALGTVSFAASGNGVLGISLVSAKEIKGTAQMVMWSCKGLGMEENITVPTPRLVQ